MKRKTVTIHLVGILIVGAAMGGYLGLRSIHVGEGSPSPAAWKTSASYYPKSPEPPEKVLFIREQEMTVTEGVMVASLQGILAKKKPEVYILPAGYASYRTWLDDLVDNYGVTVEERRSAWGLIDEYKAKVGIDGYILYDLVYENPEGSKGKAFNSSLNVATSLAGLLKAVLVEKGMETAAEAHGLSKVLDVCGKDERWLREESGYWDDLHKDLLFELEEREGYEVKMRDYAIMTDSLVFYDGNSPFRAETLNDFEDDIPVLGWGDWYSGEDEFILPTTVDGKFYVAANHAYNMSLLSAVETGDLKQKPRAAVPVANPKRHYVTFVMSDGDNLQYALAGFRWNGRLYDSIARGRIPLGWGVPASIADIAPSALQSLYDQASEGAARDEFILWGLGGYLYPGSFPVGLLPQHMKRLDRVMEKADLQVLGIIDRNEYRNKAMWETITKPRHVKGAIYVEYAGYRSPRTEITWYNGKPVIPSKEVLWTGLTNDADIRTRIDASLCDPTSSEGYTLVVVHCWSKTVEDVVYFSESLAEHVEVVSPVDFVELVTANVKRE